MKYNQKGSSLIYILLVILITSIVGYIVVAKMNILTNNVNMGVNATELYSTLFKKGTTALDSNALYNTNGGVKYKDFMSCPKDLEVYSREYDADGNLVVDDGGAPVMKKHIVATNVQLDTDNIFCQGEFAGEEFRVYFSTYGDENPFFTNIYKDGVVKKIEFASDSTYTLVPNLLDAVTYTKQGDKVIGGTSVNYVDDGNTNTTLKTDSKGKVHFTFDNPQRVSKIRLKKPSFPVYTFKYVFNFDDITSATETQVQTFHSGTTQTTIDLAARNLTARLKSFTIESMDLFWVPMHVSEIEVEGYSISGSTLVWTNTDHFPSKAGTEALEYVRFSTQTVNVADGIDDDLNSDDYHIGSLGGEHRHIYYPNKYFDDDTKARKVFIGSVVAEEQEYNIFWNNYKTDKYIRNNLNNVDLYHKRIFEVEDGRLYLDLYTEGTYNYNLKILEISKEKYENLNTIFIEKVYYGKNLAAGQGFIGVNANNELLITPNPSTEPFSFDFKNKNYAVFLENNTDGYLVYELSAQDDKGTPMYINPINDGYPDKMEVLANHVMTGINRNYIGENFKIQRKKVDESKSKNTIENLQSSCSEIKSAGFFEGDGYYTIKDGGVIKPIYCDM